MINAASDAKLYPGLNLTEKTLCDGIKYHYTSIPLTPKVDYFYSSISFKELFKNKHISSQRVNCKPSVTLCFILWRGHSSADVLCEKLCALCGYFL